MITWSKYIKKYNPGHKELCLVRLKSGLILPAIHYNNQSFYGFYEFTISYHSIQCKNYEKIKLKEKHKIKDVVEWIYLEETYIKNQL